MKAISIKQHFLVFLLISDYHFFLTSNHNDDIQRAFFFHALPWCVFSLYCCLKTFSKLGAFSHWLFFPFMDFFDIFLHMNYSIYLIMEVCSIKQRFYVFLSCGFSDYRFVQTSNHKDDSKGPFFFHALPWCVFYTLLLLINIFQIGGI